MAQFARPDSDVINTGNNGFAAIDEAIASDADFWYGDNNQADELEAGLSNVTDPSSSSGHIFRYRIAKTNAGVVSGTGSAVTVTARLMQGATQIATDTAKTADGTWTQYEYTLSGAEADAITDYADLRLEFLTSASGGSPANRRGGAVSWAELEVPAGSTQYQQTLAATSTLSPVVSSQLAFARAVAASSTLSPAMSRQLAYERALAASSVFTPQIARAIALTLAVASTFSVNARRDFYLTLEVASTFMADMQEGLVYLVSLAATSVFATAISDSLTIARTLAVSGGSWAAGMATQFIAGAGGVIRRLLFMLGIGH